MDEQLVQRAISFGFDRAGMADLAELRLDNANEVRALCAQNSCGMYGKGWMCPPGVGEVGECVARLRAYQKGLVVQSIGVLEDSFDFEGSMAAGERFRELVTGFRKLLRDELHIDELVLGAGACKACDACTYPDAPCRMPEEALASVESYGIYVMQLCQIAGLPYHNGANTVTYTGLFLLPDCDG